MNAFLTQARTSVDVDPQPHRSLYFRLLRHFSAPRANGGSTNSSAVARRFIQDRIADVATTEPDFPESIAELEGWLEQGFIDTGKAYQQYLGERREGGSRRLFSCRSHALDFLRKSAPTKLVDGSWLYGSLAHWDDSRYNDLIRIYLEELGDGDPAQNHVLIYRKLLKQHGCDDWADLDDHYFAQGAIQLALAHQAEHFLPEILGFNLGYEQLPLHLPVTAYELAELGIDPYYFTLHITIDNLDNGHARRSIAAVKTFAANAANEKEFLRRVANGYRLNGIGVGASVIAGSFDLQREVIEVLERKASVGRYLHSDRCRIQGRTLNDWLSQPDGMPDMLSALESSGWIRRHEDPARSRFWKLIEGDQPLMFGVFDAREKQLIHDWIAGDWQAPRRRVATVSPLVAQVASTNDKRAHDELRDFVATLNDDASAADSVKALIRNASPALHDSEQGLRATRIFSEHFNAGCMETLADIARARR